MRSPSLLFVLALLLSPWPLAFASAPPAPVSVCHDPAGADPALLPDCSYTTTNRSCKVAIDRFNPSTPPTIYVLPSCRVHVIVTNPYAFETLTLDWKSSAVVLAPDTYRNAFATLSGNAARIAIPFTVRLAPREKHELQPESRVAYIEDLQRQQAALANEIASFPDPANRFATLIPELRKALQPPPGGTDSPGQPWQDTAAWQSAMLHDLRELFPPTFSTIQQNIDSLDTEVAKLQKDPSNFDLAWRVNQLAEVQQTLDAAWKQGRDPYLRIQALIDGLSQLPTAGAPPSGGADIIDSAPGDTNYRDEVWTLNDQNLFAPLAERISAPTLRTEAQSGWNELPEPPHKQPIVSISVRFQSPSRLEFSTGLMVPLTPNHGYTIGDVAAAGSVTGYTVQEAKTYTVVPIALLNVLLRQWIAHRQPSAFFATGGIGVNASTSNVEFGLGGTYSYRSFAFSLLADIGRDTHLKGGLTVGQSLGTSPPLTLPTSTSFGVKPAFSIAVRIPLGGATGGP
jgi:hypothetical protein